MTLHPVTVAEVLARTAHRGQKYGRRFDYFDFHIRGVVSIVRWSHPDNWRAQTVAYLHDIVEDTDVTMTDLVQIFPLAIYEAVDLLTKGDNLSYAEYIHRIREAGGQPGALARIVKIADLKFNLNQIASTGRMMRNLEKYEAALATLEEA